MMKAIHDYFEAGLSYLAILLAFFASLPWMAIGGAVLLAARLIVDVPPALKKLKEWVKR